jgi:hypothetical protein
MNRFVLVIKLLIDVAERSCRDPFFFLRHKVRVPLVGHLPDRIELNRSPSSICFSKILPLLDYCNQHYLGLLLMLNLRRVNQ